MQGREFSLEKSTGQKNRRGRKFDGAENSMGQKNRQGGTGSCYRSLKDYGHCSHS